MLSLNDLISMPVIDFKAYHTRFVWDTFFHTPVPTVSFVQDTIGVNLIEFAGSELQAQKMLTSLAASAKTFFFGKLPYKSQEFQEFRLSRDIEALDDYLAYLMQWVIAATSGSSIEDLYALNRSGNPARAYMLEDAAALLTSKFRAVAGQCVPPDLLRKGY